MQIKDHKGNTFPSVNEMCKYHGVLYSTFKKRRQRGYTIKEALKGRKRNCDIKHHNCSDHLGNEFSSAIKMCRYWKIPCGIYSKRKQRGWSTEKALTEPVEIQISKMFAGYRIKRKLSEPYYLVSKDDAELVLTYDELFADYQKFNAI